MSDAKHVYQAITAVTAAMAGEGLGKTRENTHQNYKFRGIDDVYNSLSRHLSDQHLCVLPRVMDRTVTERETKNGGVSTYTVLTVEFDLVSSLDGSSHTIRTMGEAMDSADKSTNKAMSAAMKYACLMAFQIPTAGDNDADASHPQKASGRNGAAGGQRSASPRGAPTTGTAAPRGGAANDGWGDAEWLEWAMSHTIEMKQAESAGALKAAFASAWRDAERRGAPPNIKASLQKAKDDLKGCFSEAG